jgi:hypothetical protein
MMKTYKYILGVIAIGFVISCKKNSIPTLSYPKIVNMGTLKQHQVVSKKVFLENNSSTEIHLKKAQASCGCTIPKISDSIIAPNKKTTLSVTFDSGNRLGKIKKSIVIESNAKPTFSVIHLIANVEK